MSLNTKIPILFIFFLIGCSKKITVTGIAIEDKGGALILVNEDNKTLKKGMYFIDGLDQWSDKFYGKKVKARGILIVEKRVDYKADSPWVQQIIGTKAVLKKARWRLVKE